jgi:hypothetical protein
MILFCNKNKHRYEYPFTQYKAKLVSLLTRLSHDFKQLFRECMRTVIIRSAFTQYLQ